MTGDTKLRTSLEANGSSPALVGAGTSVERGIPLHEAEARCEATSTKLAAVGDLCASVAGDVGGFDGLVGVVAFLCWGAPGEENAEDDCGRSSDRERHRWRKVV